MTTYVIKQICIGFLFALATANASKAFHKIRFGLVF